MESGVRVISEARLRELEQASVELAAVTKERDELRQRICYEGDLRELEGQVDAARQELESLQYQISVFQGRAAGEEEAVEDCAEDDCIDSINPIPPNRILL